VTVRRTFGMVVGAGCGFLVAFVAGGIVGFSMAGQPAQDGSQSSMILPPAVRGMLQESCNEYAAAASAWRSTRQPTAWIQRASDDVAHEYDRLQAITCGLAVAGDRP